MAKKANEDSISINKYVAQLGLCSRREADRWIDAGRIRINGQIAQKGNRVKPTDTVSIDEESVQKTPKKKHTYIILNKPEGITSTTNKSDKTNIIDFIGHQKRIFPVGRLDKASTGMILLTSDGDIVNKILRESNNHEKEYYVEVDRNITKEFLTNMRNGIYIGGKKTKKCKVEKIGKMSFSITLTQGLNRQIRRMCETQRYRVKVLHRVRIMHILLGKLKPGKWRNLTPNELDQLFKSIN